MVEDTRADSRASRGAIDFQNELNEAQRRAATASPGAYLVIAGAGSGKTRTLVYRVAHLVEQGVAPESILLLTFTRRAAQEMLRRASEVLDERCRKVAGGTYHSFANLVLRRYAQHVGFDRGFTIIDRSDAVDMIGILRTEGGYDQKGRRFPRADLILSLWSKHINTQKPLEELLDEEAPQFIDDLAAIETLHRGYEERKKKQNVMDYDDLLIYLRRLLVEQPRVRKRLSSTYSHILVDEYQDTNRIQAHIAALLASGHGHIMVVGDDAQSIYSFRGADFRNIIDFPKIFPDSETILLEQNYRSTQPILSLGNAILEKAREKYAKRLFTEEPGDQRPVFVRTNDEYSQAQFVCETVLELREEGVPLQEIAVLSRAAWHTNLLEVELKSRNLPFRKFGGLRFVEAAHVKDVCAILKLSLNPMDAAAWFRVLQLFEGIGPKTAQKISQAVLDASGDLDIFEDDAWRRPRYGKSLRSLVSLVRKLEGSPSNRLEQIFSRYQRWMQRKYDNSDQRLRDLEALQVIAARYEEPEGFLSDLAIDPPDFTRRQPTDDPEDEWMTLSTVHSAKGLEWKVVFVLQMNAGRFPILSAVRGSEGFEEERRLFYVAVTRAKTQLFLVKPEEVTSRGGFHEVGELSPLIEEIERFSELTEEKIWVDPAQQWPEADAESSGEDEDRLRRIQDYFGGGGGYGGGSDFGVN